MAVEQPLGSRLARGGLPPSLLGFTLSAPQSRGGNRVFPLYGYGDRWHC